MTIQTVPTTKQTFDDFVNWYPENSLAKYELHDGKVVEIRRKSGDLSETKGKIRGDLFCEINRLDLPYSIPGYCLLKIPGKDTGYQPDIVVLDRSTFDSELRWRESSIVMNPISVRLIVEVLDENSEEKILTKCWDYEAMGIPEYWVADYKHKPELERYGRDGLPCLTVSSLRGKDYQVKKFTGDQAIKSVAFPYLKLTVNQLFN